MMAEQMANMQRTVVLMQIQMQRMAALNAQVPQQTEPEDWIMTPGEPAAFPDNES